jgi:20S proteasome alpha/beta subunit
MRLIAAFSGFSLLALGLCSIHLESARAGQPQLAKSEHPEPAASFVHGTIVVVVATKDGFVLAGDSRGTSSGCTRIPGEFEKVFAVGKRSGIVVAGLIGSSDPTREIGEAVARRRWSSGILSRLLKRR